jgi:MinD-like ATPase involved in chromosome partitioning or flagellar assembly
MKITVYSAKGSAGKTPIATNIALDKGFALGTNEIYHVFDSFFPEEKLLPVEPHENFPEIPDNIDIVFDLAGSISKQSPSISSAISQSDVVIVPIYNEIKSLNAGIHTILEVSNFTKNIIVIATKLQRQKNDVFSNWNESIEFKNIEKMVNANVDFKIPIFPLKFSKVFDLIFEKEKSINQIMEEDALSKYTYREVAKQFDNIYLFIENNYATKK